MALSRLLLYPASPGKLKHTSFAFLGCGWWLVVGGWWLVLVVVAAVVVMSWGLASDICADPRYLRPPTTRMRVKWHLQSYVRRWHTKDHDFLTLRVRGLGPADPKGRKIFWGVCMLSPWALKKSLETHPIWSSLVSFREFEAKNKTCVPGVPLYSLTTEQTRKYHITPMYAYTR